MVAPLEGIKVLEVAAGLPHRLRRAHGGYGRRGDQG